MPACPIAADYEAQLRRLDDAHREYARTQVSDPPVEGEKGALQDAKAEVRDAVLRTRDEYRKHRESCAACQSRDGPLTFHSFSPLFAYTRFVHVIGHDRKTDWPKLGPSILIATALIVAIRTAKWATKTRDPLISIMIPTSTERLTLPFESQTV